MAEFGSLDPTDWREQEAQAGLELQQKEAEAAKQRSWADTGRGILSAPYRLAKGLASAPPQAPVAPGDLPEADALLKQDPIANVLSNVGGAIKSGFTAPGDVRSGEIPEYTDGHTSPEMVHRAFDTSAMAGGASFGGKAAAAPVVAADSAKAALPVAAAEHSSPFYSALEHAVAEHPQEVAPAKQWLGTLSNKPGVKPDELKYTGTADMLAKKGDQPVTKAELQDHLEQNKVQLGEVARSASPEWKDLPGDVQHTLADRWETGGRGAEEKYNDMRAYGELPEEVKALGVARYPEYQLPGGKNYREKLLTLPTPNDNYIKFTDAMRAKYGDKPLGQLPMTDSEKAYIDKQIGAFGDNGGAYKSSHWDEPNVLAHLRMNDRDVTGNGFVVRNQVSGNASQHFPDQASANAYIDKLPESVQRQVNIVPAREAKPSLHLEEIQSDWHQQGRERGYADPELQKRGAAMVQFSHDNLFNHLLEKDVPDRAAQNMREQFLSAARSNNAGDIKLLSEQAGRVFGPEAGQLADTYGHALLNAKRASSSIPDAPFKKNWHELALKRALHDAAEGGYERLSWTPGEAQAARYDLSKQVSQLRVIKRDDGNYMLSYVPKGADYVGENSFRPMHDSPIPATKISDYVGKDVANKILEDKSIDRIGRGTLSNLDLKVGGEGMKGFYDKIVPDYLNKVGKPHGAQVRSGVTGSPEFRLIDEEGKPGQSFPTAAAGNAWLARNPEAAKFWSLSSPAGQPVHYMDIPSSLKQQLLTKGMPLFEDSSPGLAVAAAAEHTPGAKGLSFPVEEAADRLRLKVDRERKAQEKGTELAGAPANERTVLRAPKGSGLPDFATGKITPEDWVKRHEQILSPDEIGKSAKWYDEIYDNFLQHAHGDTEKASKYMRAWLVSQQNIDVSGAMANTLLQREQINRGVPESQMKAGGMPNPTTAARQVLQDKPVTGVGQKIADFVDAAEGKDTRSWMGNRPEGGKPFVVDVHTARDTGMVDQELINHLGRLGYDKKGLAKLKTDLGTSPSQTQYENRAKFGHDLTDYLNQNNWQGRSDWTPKEVQAVGWMGMTKLTANKADDVVTGLQNNMRHLSMELSPGEGSPWATKYGERFAALPAEKQRELTHQISQDAIHRASAIAGTDVRDIVHGTGGWQNFQNPSTVAQTFSSKQGAEIAANALGHLLQQTEVWSNKVKTLTANPKGFAVDLIADGNHALGTDAGLRDFWSKIMAADPTGASKNPLFQGYQPIKMPDGRVGIRVLIDRGGEGTKAALESSLSGPIKSVLEGMPGDQSFEIRRHEAEIYKARNDWKEQPNGEGYRQRLVDLVGPDRTAQLDTHGAQLEDRFRSAIEAAEGKRPEVRAPAAKAKPAAVKRKKSEPPFGSLDAGS